MGTETEAAVANPSGVEASTSTTTRIRRPRGRSGWRSAVALLLGAAALLLAILPAILFDEPVNWPWKEDAPPAASKSEGSVTIGSKGFTLTIGKHDDKDAAPPPVTPAPPPSPTKPYRVAMVIAAIAGLAFAPFAWMRERHRPIAGTGAALCCAALFWQYIVVGAAVAVGIAILLLILSALST